MVDSRYVYVPADAGASSEDDRAVGVVGRVLVTSRTRRRSAACERRRRTATGATRSTDREAGLTRRTGPREAYPPRLRLCQSRYGHARRSAAGGSNIRSGSTLALIAARRFATGPKIVSPNFSEPPSKFSGAALKM